MERSPIQMQNFTEKTNSATRSRSDNAKFVFQKTRPQEIVETADKKLKFSKNSQNAIQHEEEENKGKKKEKNRKRNEIFFLMIRRPPRSTQRRSSAASDVYRGQVQNHHPHCQDPCLQANSTE